MLNNFCFHVYAQKSLFIAENCNGFFGTSSSAAPSPVTLQSRRGGKTTKVPDFRAAITVTTLTMNENAFSLPKILDFTPRTEPLKFCRFRPILAIFSESVK